jgi:hypothetical protein
MTQLYSWHLSQLFPNGTRICVASSGGHLVMYVTLCHSDRWRKRTPDISLNFSRVAPVKRNIRRWHVEKRERKITFNWNHRKPFAGRRLENDDLENGNLETGCTSETERALWCDFKLTFRCKLVAWLAVGRNLHSEIKGNLPSWHS